MYETDETTEGAGAEEKRESEDQNRPGVKKTHQNNGKKHKQDHHVGRIFEKQRVIDGVFHVEF